jgi:hypothetical protein
VILLFIEDVVQTNFLKLFNLYKSLKISPRDGGMFFTTFEENQADSAALFNKKTPAIRSRIPIIRDGEMCSWNKRREPIRTMM